MEPMTTAAGTTHRSNHATLSALAALVIGILACCAACTRLTPAERCAAKGEVLASQGAACEPFDRQKGCGGDMECILGNDCVHEAEAKLLASRWNVGGWRLFDSSAAHERRTGLLIQELHKCRIGAMHFRGMKSDEGKANQGR